MVRKAKFTDFIPMQTELREAKARIAALEAQLAEKNEDIAYWLEMYNSARHDVEMAEQRAALKATPPAPKVTEVAIDEMAYCFWSIRPRDLDEWAKSGPAMPDGYRGGIRAWFFACEIRRALTAAQEAGKL